MLLELLRLRGRTLLNLDSHGGALRGPARGGLGLLGLRDLVGLELDLVLLDDGHEALSDFF